MTVAPAKSAQTDTFVHDRLPPINQWPQLVYNTPELQFPPQVNLVACLLDRAVHHKGWGRNPLFKTDQGDWTYGQALDEVDRIANTLTQVHGLVPGNRVLLRGGNTVAMALAWLAVVKAGLVAVATMPLLRAKELTEILTKAQPQLALCEDHRLAELHTARDHCLPQLPVLAFGSGPQVAGSLEALAAAQTPHFTACPTAATDTALLAFTSGTTGRPKAAVHTHLDVLAACETWPRHVLQLRPEDTVTGTPPLAFTFGLGGLLLFPMWAGASLYLPPQAYTPESMVHTMQRVGVTACFTAPTFYRQMAPHAQAVGLPSLRVAVSAGEGLPLATRQLWRQATGLDLLDGIGATEMFHIFISSSHSGTREGAIGRVVPGYQAKVVDEQGHEVPHGTVGKLAVVGPTGCRYLDDPRQTQYVQHGWNHPGDAFVQDADGYFFYQSRADDMIITAGYNVGGPEVEDALLQHPAVAECGVVGQPDPERGMVVKAYCVLKPGHTGDAAMTQALQDHVKNTLAPYKYPRQITYLAQLPRTETGKLQRFVLRQMAHTTGTHP
jgi:2-aminobenzoate-CoA ligase